MTVSVFVVIAQYFNTFLKVNINCENLIKIYLTYTYTFFLKEFFQLKGLKVHNHNVATAGNHGHFSESLLNDYVKTGIIVWQYFVHVLVFVIQYVFIVT